jgi:hypothetical protein
MTSVSSRIADYEAKAIDAELRAATASSDANRAHCAAQRDAYRAALSKLRSLALADDDGAPVVPDAVPPSVSSPPATTTRRANGIMGWCLTFLVVGHGLAACRCT